MSSIAKKITYVVKLGDQISTLPYDVFDVDSYGNPDSWNTKKDGTGVRILSAECLTVDQNINLYARYSSYNCTLQYIDIQPEAKVRTVSALTEFDLESSDIDGFVGWLENGQTLLNPKEIQKYRISSDTSMMMSCYTQYTLEYDKNGAQIGTMDPVSEYCSKHALLLQSGQLSVAISAKAIELADNAFTYGYDNHWFNGWLVKHTQSAMPTRMQPGDSIMLSSNAIASADWVLSSIYVLSATADPESGGTIEQSGNPTDREKSLTAIPNEGYSFSNWSTGQTSKTITVKFDQIPPAFEQSQCTSTKSITANFIDDQSYTIITYLDGTTDRIKINETLTRAAISADNPRVPIIGLKIGSAVTAFDTRALADLQQLRTVVFADPSKFMSIGNGALSGDINLRDINLSRTIISTISDSAFKSCDSLVTIDLPNQLTSIGNYAFADCANLQSLVNIKSIESIGDYTFYGCGQLLFAFSDASKIKTIGNYAFNGCYQMNAVNQIVSPSLTSIGNSAFADIRSMMFDMSSFSENSTIPFVGTNTFDLYSGCIIQFKTTEVASHFSQNSNWKTYIELFHPQPYVILSFNGNEGSGSQSAIQYMYGSIVTIPDCSFIRKKYVFTTWNTKSDGTGIEYKPGNMIALTGDLILYAQWEEAKKVMVILETAMESVGGSLLASCAKGPRDLYNCIKPSLDAAGLEAEYHLLCDSTKYPVDGIAYESPTKKNILELFEKSLNGNYAFSILYIADHGTGSACGAQGGYVTGTDLADVIKDGDPNTKILFICDCCHAAGMAPFKAASMTSLSSDTIADDVLAIALSVDYDPHGDPPNNTIIDEMFRSLDDSNRKSASKGFMAAAGNNTNPTILGWYTCESNKLGWMGNGDGMFFLKRICDKYNINSTYAEHWGKIADSPYYYKYNKKTSEYYGHTTKPPKGADVEEAHHIQYNYHGNFNTSDKVFT